MAAVPDLEEKRLKINKAWLMSCVNGRLEDIAAAAAVVKGNKVAPGVEWYLAAASADVQAEATRLGHWQALLAAGAIELPPGCGTCIGLGAGTIKAGEVGISATNRNFEGRMGDRKGLVYLGSPAVVAASAIAGYICAPTKFEHTKVRSATRTQKSSGTVGSAATPAKRAFEVIAGFPATISGKAWFLDHDNLNTDGIYAGKHTYTEGMTKEQMAGVIFENYDADFRSRAAPGDVVIGGLNFGTGSSREQAATALKCFGIPCVIATSFSETYKRNAFNNGFVVFECPQLIAFLRSTTPPGQASTRTKEAGAIAIDFAKGTLDLTLANATTTFPFPALSIVAQELIVTGGAEQAVARRLQQ
jgi:homoaconitate hydratase